MPPKNYRKHTDGELERLLELAIKELAQIKKEKER